MFITRECDYAVRVIRALTGEERLSVNEICEREQITAPFAYKILKKLQKAQIVRGYRGVHGGYAMKKSLDEITLFSVYQAIEPEMFIIECLNPKHPCRRNNCKENLPCKVHMELARVQEELFSRLQKKTLREILEEPYRNEQCGNE